MSKEENKSIVITQDVLKRLLPKEFIKASTGDPSFWQDFDQTLLPALLRAFKEGRVASVETLDRKVINKLSYMNQFEEKLHEKNKDYDKSNIISKAFDNSFSSLSEEYQERIRNVVLKYNDYIGMSKSNAKKILTKHPETKEIFAQTKASLNQFLDIISKEMKQLVDEKIREGDEARIEQRQPEITEETVVITTTRSGGAHLSIANVMKDHLRHHEIPHTTVQESDLVAIDNLKTFVGIHRNEVFNKVSQQSSQKIYAKQLKSLDDCLNQFILDKEANEFRKAIGKSEFIVSTSHHPENVRAVAEGVKRVCFQVCDFGEIPDKLEEIVKTVTEFDLSNIMFFVPSERSTIRMTAEDNILLSPRMGRKPSSSFLRQETALKGDQAKKEEYEKLLMNYEHFARVHRYPVHQAFISNPEVEALNKESEATKQKFGLRNDAKLWVMTMGSQGVGGVLEKYLDQIIDGAIADLRKSAMEQPIDVAILCGRNEGMRVELERYIEKQMREKCPQDDALYDKLRDNVQVKLIGLITPAEVASLGKISDAFLSKPGGGTAAEALFGGFPLLIHREKEQPWEFGNISELKERGAKEVSDEESFYDLAKQASKIQPPNLNHPDACVGYAIGALWSMEQSRKALQKAFE